MIVLDWPPRELHPNARVHFRARAAAAKVYREAAYWLAEKSDPAADMTIGKYKATVAFYPPDRRKRDLDGMLSAIKAGLDGISDCFSLNDYDINPITIERCEPVKGGRVEVVLS